MDIDKQKEQLKDWFVKGIYFARFFGRQFNDTRGMQTASSLAYTTLLSIVPLLAVMFGLFGKIPLLQGVSTAIQEFMFANFVPQFGEALQGYLGQFSSNASRLTFSGSMILVLIALMLMATIENAFNRIWFVTRKRNPVSRLLVYWAVLTMGPLLIGIGMASTSYILSLPLLNELDSSLNLSARLISFLPFLTTSIAFSLIYILIPNCFVIKKNAFISGVLAAILFELAKYGFGIYVRTMTSYQNIYGAVAIIPLFLIWIYVSWIIVLFGAYMSFCLTSFRLQDEIENRSKGGWRFMDALRVISYLYQAQRTGFTVSIPDLRRDAIKLPHYQLNALLETLEHAGWVNQSSNGQWLLSRDMTETTLYDLHKVLPVKLPVTDTELDKDRLARKIKLRLDSHRQGLKTSLSETIDVFLKAEAPDSGSQANNPG